MEAKIDYRLRQNKHRHMSLEERFWGKVDKKGENECWERKTLECQVKLGIDNKK